MSTKSKARAARRHAEVAPPSRRDPSRLPPEQRRAAGELIEAVLEMVTFGAIAEPE